MPDPQATLPMDQDEQLRDIFAGLALVGLLAHPGASGLQYSPESSACEAYKHADAMMAVRQRTRKE
jgi:hypothetical protein